MWTFILLLAFVGAVSLLADDSGEGCGCLVVLALIAMGLTAVGWLLL